MGGSLPCGGSPSSVPLGSPDSPPERGLGDLGSRAVRSGSVVVVQSAGGLGG